MDGEKGNEIVNAFCEAHRITYTSESDLLTESKVYSTISYLWTRRYFFGPSRKLRQFQILTGVKVQVKIILIIFLSNIYQKKLSYYLRIANIFNACLKILYFPSFWKFFKVIFYFYCTVLWGVKVMPSPSHCNQIYYLLLEALFSSPIYQWPPFLFS